MSAAVVAVIIIVIISVLVVLALVASRIAAGTARPPLTLPTGQAPEYKHRLESVRYYGQTAPASPEKTERAGDRSDEDPRHAPLPRCPSCGAAAAYGDDKCRKCGRDLAAP